jgi:hypothetical protein
MPDEISNSPKIRHINLLAELQALTDSWKSNAPVEATFPARMVAATKNDCSIILQNIINKHWPLALDSQESHGKTK